MKHEITSFNTKKLLSDTLKQTMRKKPFSKITVSEIVSACGVNRKTFYYHFEDIYALLKWMLDEEAIDVVKQFDLLTEYEDAIRFAMDYVEKNDYIINCACDSIGREEMKRFFFNDFQGVVLSVINSIEAKLQKQIAPEFKEYVSRFYTEAIAAMLIDWAKSNHKEDREKTVSYMTSIIRISIESLWERSK